MIFDFQSEEIDAKKFKNNKVIDPSLYLHNPDTKIDLFILVEHRPDKKSLENLIKYVTINHKEINFEILSALPFIPSTKDLNKQIIKLYGDNCIDLQKRIPAGSKVITVGRALYAITKSNDLAIEGFYDTILWRTSFFAPEINSRIFPVPFLQSWLGKDAFENYFTNQQFKIAKNYNMQKSRIPKPKLILEEDPNKHLEKWLNYNGVVSWDLETKYLDPWSKDSKILCLTCAYEEEIKEYKAYFLPFDKIDLDLLEKWFSNKKKVGNNLKYDVKWLRVKHNIKREALKVFWDNMKGTHAINEMQYNSLKSDAWLYTPFGGYDIELENYKEKYPRCKNDYSLIPQDILFEYATMDALVSLLCYREQQKEVDALDKHCPVDTGWSIRRALEEVAFPAINTFIDMEVQGMYYNWGRLKEVEQLFDREIKVSREAIYKALNIPEHINIDSGDQLGTFLEEIGWENPGRSKKGIYLTNEACKDYWRKKGHTEIDLFDTYDDLRNCMKTYVGHEADNSGYWQYRSGDDKLHPSFNVMMAYSWRNKCRNPNLQNIIARSTMEIDGTPIHYLVRSCFSTPKGFYISENDASGLQLRIATSMSLDPVMVDIFTKKGGDMHSITARSVFCPDITLEEFIAKRREEPFATWREKAKAINFGLLFGATSRVFAQISLVPEWTFKEVEDYVKDQNLEEKRIRMERRLLQNYNKRFHGEYDVFCIDQKTFSYYWVSAEDIRNKFFATYKGLLDWHKKQIFFASKNGYISSLWGPIRRTPFLVYQGKQDDRARIKNYENISLNSPVQNFEALWIMYNLSRSNERFYAENLESYFVSNTHDSIVHYPKVEELLKTKEIMEEYFHEEMPEVMKGIPYLMEFGYSDYEKGEYWGVKEREF